MKTLTGVVLAAVVAGAGFARAEEAPAAPPPAVTDAKVRLETRGHAKVFVFEAKTTRKEGERVKVKLFYVQRYKIPPGLVGPGEPDFGEELVDVDKGDLVVKDGTLTAELGASDVDPWPGRFRVEASWPDPNATSEDGMATAQADVEVGDPKDLPGMRARADREVYEDLARIGRVLAEMGERWKHLGATADPTWAEYRKVAGRRIDAVKQRNGRRRSAEFYWMESRGKMRIDWILQKLCPLLDTETQYLSKPADARPDPKDLDVALADTEEDYQHYLDYLGIGRIVDADKVDEALARVAEIAGDVKGWREKAAGDPAAWMEASIDLSARLVDSALKLSAELPEAYFARAEAVERTALKLIDHVRELSAGKKPATEWEELEKKLDGALKEVRESVPRVKDE